MKTKQICLKPSQDLPSLNNGQKCRKPVFMRVSGICFIKWLWFGSICGRVIDANVIIQKNEKEKMI